MSNQSYLSVRDPVPAYTQKSTDLLLGMIPLLNECQQREKGRIRDLSLLSISFQSNVETDSENEILIFHDLSLFIFSSTKAVCFFIILKKNKAFRS